MEGSGGGAGSGSILHCLRNSMESRKISEKKHCAEFTGLCRKNPEEKKGQRAEEKK